MITFREQSVGAFLLTVLGLFVSLVVVRLGWEVGAWIWGLL